MSRGLLFALMLGASPAMAEDVALIVANDDDQNGWGLWDADDLTDAAKRFEAAGFRVYLGENLGAEALRALASDFASDADGSGRIVIALAGHFAQSESGAWFLGADADSPDLISVGAEGLSISVLYEIAARAPGRAVVLLGAEDRGVDLGAALAPGTGDLSVPQGVTLIRGEVDDVAEFAGEGLLVPGRTLAASLRAHSGLRAEGFLTDAYPFIDELPAPTAAMPEGERAAWATALAEDTIEAYEEFLSTHPQGTNAPLARAAIARLDTDPDREARVAEEALALSRDDRRKVQRNLTLLSFDTRGIDGVFGPASRRAIAAWQRTNGYAPSGFLNREVTERIEAQAVIRAGELEAEASARQAEQARLDRAYWADTGAKGDEAGLRAYLRRYPDGLYAEVAQERLKPYEEDREGAAQAADRAAWARARDRDTIAAYREYLTAQPSGAFRDRAQERIDALGREGDTTDAIRAEAALGLNVFTRNLVEARLDSLGLRPGRVDGVFDQNTRRAIRRYQTARELPVTGYLSQQTLVRLLADSSPIRN